MGGQQQLFHSNCWHDYRYFVITQFLYLWHSTDMQVRNTCRYSVWGNCFSCTDVYQHFLQRHRSWADKKVGNIILFQQYWSMQATWLSNSCVSLWRIIRILDGVNLSLLPTQESWLLELPLGGAVFICHSPSGHCCLHGTSHEEMAVVCRKRCLSNGAKVQWVGLPVQCVGAKKAAVGQVQAFNQGVGLLTVSSEVSSQLSCQTWGNC